MASLFSEIWDWIINEVTPIWPSHYLVFKLFAHASGAGSYFFQVTWERYVCLPFPIFVQPRRNLDNIREWGFRFQFQSFRRLSADVRISAIHLHFWCIWQNKVFVSDFHYTVLAITSFGIWCESRFFNSEIKRSYETPNATSNVFAIRVVMNIGDVVNGYSLLQLS